VQEMVGATLIFVVMIYLGLSQIYGKI